MKLHKSPVLLFEFLTHEPSNVVILLWVILRLPALQLFEAEETHGDVRAVFWRGVNEASFGHLEKQMNRQTTFKKAVFNAEMTSQLID